MTGVLEAIPMWVVFLEKHRAPFEVDGRSFAFAGKPKKSDSSQLKPWQDAMAEAKDLKAQGKLSDADLAMPFREFVSKKIYPKYKKSGGGDESDIEDEDQDFVSENDVDVDVDVDEDVEEEDDVDSEDFEFEIEGGAKKPSAFTPIVKTSDYAVYTFSFQPRKSKRETPKMPPTTTVIAQIVRNAIESQLYDADNFPEVACFPVSGREKHAVTFYSYKYAVKTSAKTGKESVVVGKDSFTRQSVYHDNKFKQGAVADPEAAARRDARDAILEAGKKKFVGCLTEGKKKYTAAEAEEAWRVLESTCRRWKELGDRARKPGSPSPKKTEKQKKKSDKKSKGKKST